MPETAISLTASFAPEFRLLVACARTTLDAPSAAQLSALVRQPLDWSRLLALARHHGVTPLLHRHLGRTADMPDAVRTELARYTRDNAVHNLVLAQALLGLVGALAAQGVSALPYKGPLLGVCAYGDLSLRASKDLDVLVRPEDFGRATEVLVRLGYTPGVHGLYHQSFVKAETGVELELHHDVLRREQFPTPLDLGAMWARRTQVSMLGIEVEGFSPEDTLLLLCLHGSKHLWAGLIWLCDVSEYVRAHPSLDWARFLETAERARLSRPVLLGLKLAHDVLGAPLPKSMQREISADSRLRALERTVLTRLHTAKRRAGLRRKVSWLWLRLELHFGSAPLTLAKRLTAQLLKPQAKDYRAGGQRDARLVRLQRVLGRGLRVLSKPGGAGRSNPRDIRSRGRNSNPTP